MKKQILMLTSVFHANVTVADFAIAQAVIDVYCEISSVHTELW